MALQKVPWLNVTTKDFVLSTKFFVVLQNSGARRQPAAA